MKVKRFFSATMQEALKMVREDLGPDAVILSNEKQHGGVEIVAALDYEEQVAAQELNSDATVSPTKVAKMHAEKHLRLQQELDKAKRHIDAVKSKQQTRPSAAASVDSRASTPSAGMAIQTPENWSELSDMKAEIQALKGLISEQVAARPSANSGQHLSLVQQQVESMLESLCLAKPIRRPLIDAVKTAPDYDSAWQAVRLQLEGALAIEHGEIIDQSGVIALVGPTGSGKTMTIGKMAARYVMKYGADGIALVTTDRYRIAAHEQLKVFGRILNVPVHSVDEANSLDQILDQLSSKKLVLIDTAGLMHSDSCWPEQLQEIKLSAHRIQSYLVMSAVGQYQVMCANYHHYKMVGLAGAILTKIDEAVSLGEAISFLIDSRLRAAYFTDGQRVPEDIHRLDKQQFLDKAEALLNTTERWVTISSAVTDSGSEAVYSHSA